MHQRGERIFPVYTWVIEPGISKFIRTVISCITICYTHALPYVIFLLHKSIYNKVVKYTAFQSICLLFFTEALPWKSLW